MRRHGSGKHKHRANPFHYGKAVLCSNIHQKAYRGTRMRQCKCGGQVRQSELTDDRVTWTCTSCKTYEIFQAEFFYGGNRQGFEPINSSSSKSCHTSMECQVGKESV